MPGTFAENVQDAGMFYQWNRRIGWSSLDPLVNSDGGITWDSSTPTGTTWYAENDPCPDGWRVPTQAELQSLNNAGSTSIIIQASFFGHVRGTSGRLYGTAPNQIVLPYTGWRHRNNGSGGATFLQGNYWSSTQNNITGTLAWLFSIDANNSRMINGNFADGFSVRCVQE